MSPAITPYGSILQAARPMIHALIPLAAIALIALILLIIDHARIREERRRTNLWRQRAPRRRSAR